MKEVDKRKQDCKEINECDMQVDDTLSSSFTQSSSMQSADKDDVSFLFIFIFLFCGLLILFLVIYQIDHLFVCIT